MAILSRLLLWRRVIILIATPIALLPLITVFDSSETKCSYLLILMAVYWVTETLPVGVTSLLPVVFFPFFEIVSSAEISAQYVNDANMLFLGGLLMSAAIEYWQLHKRTALSILRYVGPEPRWLLLGIMLTTWFTSMWISNTAATAMMVPIVEAILIQFKDSDIERSLFSPTRDVLKTLKGALSGDVITVGDVTASTSFTTATQTTSTGQSSGESEDIQEGNVQQLRNVLQDVIQKDTLSEPPEEDENFVRFGKALSLCVCYSATCGGIACITGTGTNLALKAYTDVLYAAHDLENPLTFNTWLWFGVPLSLMVLLICWAWLQMYYISDRENTSDLSHEQYYTNKLKTIKDIIESEYQKLGSLLFGQVMVIGLFLMLVLLWVTRDLGGVVGWGDYFDPPVKDSAPAIFIAVLLFCLPCTAPWLKAYNDPNHPGRWNRSKGHSRHRKATKIGTWVIRPLLTWDVAQQKVPWHIFLLLGGGYALSKGSEKSGLSTWIGLHLESLKGWNEWGMLILICYVTAASTEFTSNAAVATLLLPIMAQLALNTGVHPLYYMLPCTHACSFAFMLPVATPPNAIVFSYGRVKISDMVRTGLVLNIVAVPILIAVTGTIGNAIFDFDEIPLAFYNESLLRQEILNDDTA
ncbi:Na(+)/citrate cotransporter-like [Physella acuta]|uniref:Na(+)/citrate cotransporter-like n=1 Tax=Physella acuta TaxID=109671 RepID=UPI0027DAE997|nr:Na(+)/citrate cotransporter-like [Physella acuta]